MKYLWIILYFLVSVLSIEFDEYVKKFNKTYDSEKEYYFRKEIFEANLRHFTFMNNLTLKYKLGVNNYSDWTSQQLNQTNWNPPPFINFNSSSQKIPMKKLRSLEKLPSVLDWRQKGGVSPVKNQRTCSSCWAFTTVALAESFLMIKTGNTYNLSQEYLIECTSGSSCSGGNLTDAAHTILKFNGLPQANDYPYIGQYYPSRSNYSVTQNGICTPKNVVPFPQNAMLMIYQNITVDQIKILIQDAPVMAYMHITSDFHSYESGIFSCNSPVSRTQLNYHTQIIGYNDIDQYLMIKVAKGPNWGEKGFAAIDMNMNCGITFDVYQFVESYWVSMKYYLLLAILVISYI